MYNNVVLKLICLDGCSKIFLKALARYKDLVEEKHIAIYLMAAHRSYRKIMRNVFTKCV